MHAALIALSALCAANAAEMPIVHIGMTDGTRITALAAPDEPNYVATDTDGRRLNDPMSLDDLQANHPALYNRLSNGVADDLELEDAKPLAWAGI